MTSPVDVTKVILSKLEPEFNVWDALVKAGSISQSAAEERKGSRLQEEVQKHFEMERKKADYASYTKEEKDDNPWKRSISNAVKAFSLHDANYAADPDAWEKTMRDNFTSKAHEKILSPFETIVGLYLLFGEDYAVSRRHLIALLFQEDASHLVEYHNWEVATSYADPAFVETNGERIVSLSCPLFPPKNEVLQGLNTAMLNIAAAAPISGGGKVARRRTNIEEDLWHFFSKNRSGELLGGAYALNVLDPSGQPTGYYVDCSQMEQAIDFLQANLESADTNLLTELRSLKDALFRRVKYLEEMMRSQSAAPRKNYPHSAGTRRTGRGRGHPQWRGNGGDVEENEQKNCKAPAAK